MSKTTDNSKELIDFNFPAHDLTIKAKTIEEAQEKLKEILSDKK